MHTCRFVLVVLLLSTSAQLSSAEHWNQFRGPNGDGQASSKALPFRWSESKNIAWKTAVHGKAWSSPVIWGNQVWMTSATKDGKKLFAICVDATSGKIVHDITVLEIEKPMFCIGYNSYASPTPVVEQGRLWVHYGSAGTACLDTSSGKILWARQDLPCNHHRGPGSSPIVFRDLLIVNFDGFDQQYVVAMDKSNGKTVWKKDRSFNYRTTNGDAKKAYSTPAVIEHNGRLQLISMAAVATVAYDPLTGKELWWVYHGGFNAAARPLYSHGKVFLSFEGGLKFLAVRPDGFGDVTKTHIAWTYKKAMPTRPSQLIVDDHVYLINDGGIVTCLNAKTGKPTWVHRIGGRYTASPIHANGRIYLFGEDGPIRVIAANPRKFELLAANKLEEGSMASPAVIDDALIIRTKTHLYRVQR